MFVDSVKIHVRGGHGGAGCLCFRREKYVPRGGPDGGDGGDGGSVIIIADEDANHLAPLVHRKHWEAEPGKAGGPANRQGKSGEDLIIRVPAGTLVTEAKEGLVLRDLVKPGDQVIAAKGGRGGRGNASFKTAENRAPRETTPGDEGENRELILELKLIADVGLVGKPNAGKSTLLSCMTRARPEIANYPFTTKQPHLGLSKIDIDRSFVMADIPGLIERASEGAGLGLEFLKHVERTRVFVHLIEPSPMDETDPIKNYRAIRHELSEYDPKLLARPEILVVSKGELPDAEEVRERLAAETGKEVLRISAATGLGLDVLRMRILRQLDELGPAVS